eukprot:PITA_07123
MPFGLMNVGATFQRAMDITFLGEKDKFVLVYLDDITVYSNRHQDHLQHLKKVFLKCRRFGISMNPKKSQFALEKGKLLGYIVSTVGVKYDPERVKAIQALSVPRTKKDIQSFLGKINFVRRFIHNFEELVKHITSMLKKESEIKWTNAPRRSFEDIKIDIMEATTFISPDYSKEFHIFSFASGDTLAAVLLQKDDEGSEHLVAFFSKTLRDAKLRYDNIEKQAYALIKSLKAFRIYILHSKVIAYVPAASVKDVLMQPDVDGRRAKWIAKLIEFNIELKPTKLIKGQGLAKLMDEENCRMLDMNWIGTSLDDRKTGEETVERGQNQDLAKNLASCEWYSAIAHFLLKLEVAPGLSSSQARTIKLRATKFCIHEDLLYWRDSSGILLRCLEKEQFMEVTTKKSTRNSTFKLVYGTKVVLPIQLTLLVAKFLQQEQNEENDMAKRISDLAEVHQIRDQLFERSATHQKRIKEAFDRKAKINSFQVGDLVLKWDALKEKKGNHGKFDALRTGPFVIA